MQQEIQQLTKILLIIERVLHGMEIQIVVIFSCGILQRMDGKREMLKIQRIVILFILNQNWAKA